MNRFSRVYTLHLGADSDLAPYLNVTYIIENYDVRELMIRYRRPENESNLYTDNSAFHLLRKHNASWAIGKNTYPYVNGMIWDYP